MAARTRQWDRSRGGHTCSKSGQFGITRLEDGQYQLVDYWAPCEDAENEEARKANVRTTVKRVLGTYPTQAEAKAAAGMDHDGGGKRFDAHRLGAFVPADYDYAFSFSMAHVVDGWPMPSINIDMIVDLRRAGLMADTGNGTNVCDVCGAWFVHGDVWEHRPTGECITMGHICADKYSMAADRADWARLKASQIQRIMAEGQRTRNREAAEAFLAEHAGLAEALEVDHHISSDMKARLLWYGSLSPGQLELAFKLKREADARKAREDEEARITWKPVPNDDARREVEGLVLHTKYVEGDYGTQFKQLVRVDEADGSFKLWGTVPKALEDEREYERGARVRFTAKLQRSDDDPHFGFYSRPTKPSVVGAVKDDECPRCDGTKEAECAPGDGPDLENAIGTTATVPCPECEAPSERELVKSERQQMGICD